LASAPDQTASTSIEPPDSPPPVSAGSLADGLGLGEAAELGELFGEAVEPVPPPLPPPPHAASTEHAATAAKVVSVLGIDLRMG